ncbi:hypothetical protein RTBOTA2_005946 [Rhodotorula toruloides]|nr:hypothetical protein RTBOTA2_005946 [Rhodotorula toruloides]
MPRPADELARPQSVRKEVREDMSEQFEWERGDWGGSAGAEGPLILLEGHTSRPAASIDTQDTRTCPNPSFSRPLPFLSFLEGVVALEAGSKGGMLMRVVEGSWVSGRVLGVSGESFGKREGVEEVMRAIWACG